MNRISQQHLRTRDGLNTASVVRGNADVTTVMTRRRLLSPAGLIGSAIGAGFLVVGLIGLVRGDLNGPLNEPTYEVAGFVHSPTLSFVEIGVGVALLLCALTGWLSGMLFAGSALIVAAIVALVETSPLGNRFVIDRSFSWAVLALGSIVVAAGWLMPTMHEDRRVSERSDHDIIDRRDVL